MPNDDALRELFAGLAAGSGGALSFRVTTSAQFAEETGLSLSRSPNPLYVFTVNAPPGTPRTFVAFTLSLNGLGRPATRAEALGRSLAESHGRLFDFNPILLVHDYASDRLLAVSAAELFGAFAKHAASTSIPYSGSSSFSLSPNFEHGTISMYATVQSPTVWASPATANSVTLEVLSSYLDRVADETASKAGDIPAIVDSIRKRLAAAPGDASTSTATATSVAAPSDFAKIDPVDDAVKVDDRLWQMILSAIASSAGVILVGPPGTGKSALLRKAIGAINQSRMADGKPGLREPLWATPDEGWTSRELIGGETISDNDIVFRPGWVLRAIADDRWLVLDEANRGDLDRIFGALLTWLAGGTVAVGIESAAEDAKTVELGWTSGTSRVEVIEASDPNPGKIRYLASESEWKLLGTYNALDAQRVFRIGAALGRRFVRVPIPPVSPADFDSILASRADDLPEVLRQRIGLMYTAHYGAEVTRVGPALFLGMCAYLRSAIAMRGLADEDSDAASDGGEHETGASSETAFDEILSEAYVLNLGTLLAQLEEPDFSQLASRLEASSALSEEGIKWVGKMMKALA